MARSNLSGLGGGSALGGTVLFSTPVAAAAAGAMHHSLHTHGNGRGASQAMECNGITLNFHPHMHREPHHIVHTTVTPLVLPSPQECRHGL